MVFPHKTFLTQFHKSWLGLVTEFLETVRPERSWVEYVPCYSVVCSLNSGKGT